MNLLVADLADDPMVHEDIKIISGVVKEHGRYISHKMIGYYYRNINGVSNHELRYEVETEEGHMGYIIAYTRRNGVYGVTDLNMTILEAPLSDLNRFTLDKEINQLLYLCLVILVFAFMISTSIMAFSGDRNPVIWALLSLSGVGLIVMSWTTGHLTFHLLTIGLPTAGISKQGANGAFFLSLRFPLGALGFWLMRFRSRLKTQEKLTLEETS